MTLLSWMREKADGDELNPYHPHFRSHQHRFAGRGFGGISRLLSPSRGKRQTPQAMLPKRRRKAGWAVCKVKRPAPCPFKMTDCPLTEVAMGGDGVHLLDIITR